jgi:hypothetical protein
MKLADEHTVVRLALLDGSQESKNITQGLVGFWCIKDVLDNVGEDHEQSLEFQPGCIRRESDESTRTSDKKVECIATATACRSVTSISVATPKAPMRMAVEDPAVHLSGPDIDRGIDSKPLVHIEFMKDKIGHGWGTGALREVQLTENWSIGCTTGAHLRFVRRSIHLLVEMRILGG